MSLKEYSKKRKFSCTKKTTEPKDTLKKTFPKNFKHSIRKTGRTPYDDIDEVMIPIIKLLNKKGHKTLACCSGHPEGHLKGKFRDWSWEGYILFKKKESMKKIVSIILFESGTYEEFSPWISAVKSRNGWAFYLLADELKQKEIDLVWREIYKLLKKRLKCL